MNTSLQLISIRLLLYLLYDYINDSNCGYCIFNACGERLIVLIYPGTLVGRLSDGSHRWMALMGSVGWLLMGGK